MSIDTKAHYESFMKWCAGNPAFGLDPRLHTHAGPIEHGGYISHHETNIAFAAFRAGLSIAADRLAELEAENERLNARLNAAQLTTYEMTLESCVEQCEKDPAALEHLRPTLQRLANALEGGDERKVEADASLTEAAPELLKALQAAIDCGMVPQSTAEDGAVRHSRHVQVADMIRAAITKATGGAQ